MSTPASAVQISAAQKAMVLGQDLPFWYPINVALTANQTGVQGTVTMDNDADFELRELLATSTGIFSVTLIDRYTSRPMMTAPINNLNMFGTAQLPFILPIPYTLLRTATLAVTFNDLSAAPNTIQLAFWGYKKFGR